MFPGIVDRMSKEIIVFNSKEHEHSDGINTNNAQLSFIPSCESLIGINQIE